MKETSLKRLHNVWFHSRYTLEMAKVKGERKFNTPEIRAKRRVWLRKDLKEGFWGELFCILIVVVATSIYTYVTTHSTTHTQVIHCANSKSLKITKHIKYIHLTRRIEREKEYCLHWQIRKLIYDVQGHSTNKW